MKILMTDRALAGLKPQTRRTYFDKKTVGLALQAGARKRTWFFVYRNGGASQWLKLGEYPALPLADARARVLGERNKLTNEGLDPVEERQRLLEPPPVPPAAPPPFTFADFVPVFVKFQSGRTKHWEDEHGKIKRYLVPAWGSLPLKAITRTHVVELLDTVEGKGLTAGVNRVQAVISRMFTVALNRGLIDSHPAARLIKRFAEQPRDRVLADAELRELWAGLDAQPGAASDAVRLRLLLGQRGGETVGLTRGEVDVEAATWTLPGARTKNRRPHVVALPPTALALVKQRLEHAAADPTARLFPDLSSQDDEHRALGSINGGAYEWTDLRRTVATRLAELGFDETVIGRVLNHARYTVTAKHYNQHAYVEEIRLALTAWDTELQRILKNEPKKKPRVLAMRRRR